MSTDLMLRCVSHDPYIQSGDVGRNLEYLPQIRKDVENRDKLVELVKASDYFNFSLDSQYRTVTAFFLYNHPHCDLELWDEYGEQYSLEEPDAEDDLGGIGVNTVLGKAVSILQDDEGVFVKFELNDDGKRVVDRIKRNLGSHYSIFKKENNEG